MRLMVLSIDVAPSGAGGGRDPADPSQGEQSSEDMGDQSESGQSPQVRSAEASRGSGLDADGQRDRRGLASQDLGEGGHDHSGSSSRSSAFRQWSHLTYQEVATKEPGYCR